MQEKRKVMAISLATAGLLVLGQVALAGQYAGPNRDRGGLRVMDPGQRLERLSKELKLTDEQKAQLMPILEDEQKQFQAIRNDDSLSREERWSKMQGIRQASRERMNAVLTPAQQEKLKKRHETRQRRWEGPGGGDRN